MTLIHGGDWAGFLEQYGAMPVDFSSNISPLGLPEGVRQAAVASLDQADRYPDPLCRRLRAVLSARHEVAEERIVCGNGAADIIYRLAFALRPDKVLIPAPSFAEYALAMTAAGAKVRYFPLRREKGFLLGEEILAQIEPGLDLLILCEPNNPSGRTTEQRLLGRIRERCAAAGTLLLVDECFLPFVEDEAAHTLLGDLSAGENLIILRAFTKWYAMAGLRLGYALCGNDELARQLRNCGQPWAVSTPAQEAGLAALGAVGYDERLRTVIAQGRMQLLTGLRELGLEVVPGEANFLLFFCAVPGLGIKLMERGFLLRDCANFVGLESGWYRAAVRTQEENAALLTALREVIEGD